MRKEISIALVLALAVAAIVIPIWVAIQISEVQSNRAETGHMLAYARDVLNRSDATTDQIAAGIEKLTSGDATTPCSASQIELMREIDIGSSYIQTMGHISGNGLICSSLGLHSPPLDLGPVDLVTANGVIVRANVQFPFAKGQSFIVVEKNGYAAIIHKSLPIDATTDEKEVSLALFAVDSGMVLTSRGFIDPLWIQRLRGNHQATFNDGGHLVALVSSTKHRIVAVSALPESVLEERTRGAAWRIIPIGVVCGLVLAVSVFHFAMLQQSMPTALRGALKRREFFLVYQPVVDLRTGEWVGAEALVRWKFPSGNIVPPDVFIPVAENARLISHITEQVMDIVRRDAVELFKKHPNFHIAINLSSADLHTVHTVELLQRLMRDTSASAANLVVEATERGFLAVGSAKNIIHKIRELGVRTSIDDFGTGYSSLSYLERLEIDFLKIDKSFVDTIGTEAPTSHVVLHIIELAKDLGLEIIAEGVETEAQAKFLRDRGVQFSQGLLFAKPMSIAELERNLPASQGEA